MWAWKSFVKNEGYEISPDLQDNKLACRSFREMDKRRQTPMSKRKKKNLIIQGIENSTSFMLSSVDATHGSQQSQMHSKHLKYG